jgi:hypothetical protein
MAPTPTAAAALEPAQGKTSRQAALAAVLLECLAHLGLQGSLLLLLELLVGVLTQQQ